MRTPKSGRLETRLEPDQIFTEPQAVNILPYQNTKICHCNIMCQCCYKILSYWHKKVSRLNIKRRQVKRNRE
jgi:hypothetical protein